MERQGLLSDSGYVVLEAYKQAQVVEIKRKHIFLLISIYLVDLIPLLLCCPQEACYWLLNIW